MRSSSVRGSYRNRLLALLPAASIEQLAPHLTPVDLPVNRTLQRPGEKMESVYFLEDGICSMVVPLSSGATVEVGRIGRDGFVGAAAILDTAQAPYRCFMAIPGHGLQHQDQNPAAAFGGVAAAAPFASAQRAVAAGADGANRGVQSRPRAAETSGALDSDVRRPDRGRPCSRNPGDAGHDAGHAAQLDQRGRQRPAGCRIDFLDARPHDHPRSRGTGQGCVRVLRGRQRRVSAAGASLGNDDSVPPRPRCRKVQA